MLNNNIVKANIKLTFCPNVLTISTDFVPILSSSLDLARHMFFKYWAAIVDVVLL